MKHILASLLFVCVAVSMATAQYNRVFSASAHLVRPNDESAYAAGDVVNDSTTSNSLVLVFPLVNKDSSVVRGDAVGNIEYVFAMSDSSNVKELLIDFYADSVAIPRAADNAAGNAGLTAAKFGRHIGSVSITIGDSVAAAAGQGTTEGFKLPFVLPSVATGICNIYAVVRVKVAFTPAALEDFYFLIRGVYQ